MAMAELHMGHSDLVITGGADTMNDIFMYILFQQDAGAVADRPNCLPFLLGAPVRNGSVIISRPLRKVRPRRERPASPSATAPAFAETDVHEDVVSMVSAPPGDDEVEWPMCSSAMAMDRRGQTAGGKPRGHAVVPPKSRRLAMRPATTLPKFQGTSSPAIRRSGRRCARSVVDLSSARPISRGP